MSAAKYQADLEFHQRYLLRQQSEVNVMRDAIRTLQEGIADLVKDNQRRGRLILRIENAITAADPIRMAV
jgi:hypothetical protein